MDFHLANKASSRTHIGVGKGSRPPRPPNRAGGFPAHGSPVGSCLIGTDCRTASQERFRRSALPRQSANTGPVHHLRLAWIVPASCRHLPEGYPMTWLVALTVFLPSCPAFPRPGFANPASRGLCRFGTMRALTPDPLRSEGQVSPLKPLCFLSIPSPTTTCARTSLYQSP